MESRVHLLRLSTNKSRGLLCPPGNAKCKVVALTCVSCVDVQPDFLLLTDRPDLIQTVEWAAVGSAQGGHSLQTQTTYQVQHSTSGLSLTIVWISWQQWIKETACTSASWALNSVVVTFAVFTSLLYLIIKINALGCCYVGIGRSLFSKKDKFLWKQVLRSKQLFHYLYMSTD